ncbi:MAG: hypothetical protein ACPL07_01175 [Candidatus Bathyarchaeia archaeon]
MESVRYSEWVPAGALVKGLTALVAAIIIVFTSFLILLSGEASAEDFQGLLFSWGALAFILFVSWNYRGIRIQITNSRLNVDYGLFNRRSFLLEDIVSCSRIKACFGRYLGVGVRLGFDGSLAYTTSFGEAVMVVPRKGRRFVFSSNSPDQVCSIIGEGVQPE